MNGELEATVHEYISCLSIRCPNLLPSIYPANQYQPKTLADLCTNEQQHAALKAWFSKQGFVEDEFSFPTSINFKSREVTITQVKVCGYYRVKYPIISSSLLSI